MGHAEEGIIKQKLGTDNNRREWILSGLKYCYNGADKMLEIQHVRVDVPVPNVRVVYLFQMATKKPPQTPRA